MSEKRMAGSDEFKKELSNAERNRQIREEIGNDPERLAARISGVDREKYDFEGFTDKQINMALQGETFGDKDYERLTGKSLGGDDAETPVTPPDSGDGGGNGGGGSTTPPMPNPPVSGFGQSIVNTATQNINQDNDQTNTITGNNNQVVQNQDNSINGYSGTGWKDAWMKDYFA